MSHEWNDKEFEEYLGSCPCLDEHEMVASESDKFSGMVAGVCFLLFIAITVIAAIIDPINKAKSEITELKGKYAACLLENKELADLLNSK